MKGVLMSIQPKWCQLIADKKKVVEVRKTRPKLETPFKVYIYCTVDKKREVFFTKEVFDGEKGKWAIPHVGNGKVIGEFICDRIEDFYCASVPYKKENNLGYGRFVDNGVYKVDGWHEGVVFERNDRYIDTMLNNNDLKEMCLSAQEVFDYIGIGKHLYAWHISDLKIYDKPKELSEFYAKCNIPESKCKLCDNCYDRADYYDRHYAVKKLTRPPQSWCYVEVER